MIKVRLTNKQKEYLRRKFGIIPTDMAQVEKIHSFGNYLFVTIEDEFGTTFHSKVTATKENIEQFKGKVEEYNSDRNHFIV